MLHQLLLPVVWDSESASGQKDGVTEKRAFLSYNNNTTGNMLNLLIITEHLVSFTQLSRFRSCPCAKCIQQQFHKIITQKISKREKSVYSNQPSPTGLHRHTARPNPRYDNGTNQSLPCVANRTKHLFNY